MNSFTPHKFHGFCTSCDQIHLLEENNITREKSLELMELFKRHQSIDIFSSKPDRKFSTDSLFSEARGKMFGVLHAKDPSGKDVILFAFSGQYATSWNVPGWSPPLFDSEKFHTINNGTEPKIKKITKHLTQFNTLQHPKSAKVLKNKRKQMSQQLMKDIHNIYQLHNFNDEKKTLEEAFYKTSGIPTGTGDCCAPKLLNQAAKLKLSAVAISEFYWGKENKSGSKIHKQFYSSCSNKCEPILGFLLCGTQ